MTTRRQLFTQVGTAALGAALAGHNVAQAATVPADNLEPAGSGQLKALSDALAKAPRRRDFKTVPMILTDSSDWDAEALKLLLDYKAGPRQLWDNTDLASPWLNLMRNAMNAQIWSWKHPDFLAVSATHGTAHLALYDDAIWSKYGFAKMLKDKFKSNVFITQPKAAGDKPSDDEAPEGVFSPADNSVTVLQRRGAMFLACHNEVWELTRMLHKKGINPDKLSHPQMAAEFTNHLIPGAVLTPGVVGTIPELQLAGYQYIK